MEGRELEVVSREEYFEGFVTDGAGYLDEDEELSDAFPVATVGATERVE
jgi:hypothetical protein